MDDRIASDKGRKYETTLLAPANHCWGAKWWGPTTSGSLSFSQSGSSALATPTTEASATCVPPRSGVALYGLFKTKRSICSFTVCVSILFTDIRLLQLFVKVRPNGRQVAMARASDGAHTASALLSTGALRTRRSPLAAPGPSLTHPPPACPKSQGPAQVAEKPDYFFFLKTSTIPLSPSTRTTSPVSITSVGSRSKSVTVGTSMFMAANTVRLLPLL